jgi:hypothetical protein
MARYSNTNDTKVNFYNTLSGHVNYGTIELWV